MPAFTVDSDFQTVGVVVAMKTSQGGRRRQGARMRGAGEQALLQLQSSVQEPARHDPRWHAGTDEPNARPASPSKVQDPTVRSLKLRHRNRRYWPIVT
jgi:hypothetical protein